MKFAKVASSLLLSVVSSHAMEEQSSLSTSSLKRKHETIVPEGMRADTANKMAKTSPTVDADAGAKLSSIRDKICQRILSGGKEKKNNETPLEMDSSLSLQEAVASKVPGLTVVNLSGFSIDDEILAETLLALSAATNLKKLDLRFNKISVKGAQALADSLKYYPNLEVLSLDENPLSDEGVKLIVGALQQVKTSLRKLWLVDVEIGAEGACSVANLLRSKNTALVKLDMTANHIKPKGVRAILSALIDENESLEWLDLGYNNIDENSAALLGVVLNANTTLQSITCLGLRDYKLARKSVLSSLPENSKLSTFEMGRPDEDEEGDEVEKAKFQLEAAKLGRLAKQKKVKLIITY